MLYSGTTIRGSNVQGHRDCVAVSWNVDVCDDHRHYSRILL
jgi:hypothetical protein